MHRERIHPSPRPNRSIQPQEVCRPAAFDVLDYSINGKKPAMPLLLMMLYFKPPTPQEGHDVSRETTDFNRRYKEMLANIKREKVPEKSERYPDYVANIEEATRFVEKEEFGRQPRRTEEPVYIHFKRVFLRGMQDMLSVAAKHESVVFTSLLARLLHDSKEDVENFSISLFEEGQNTNTYEFSYKNAKIRYFLQLTPEEKGLLDMQINALTIPKKFKGKTKNGNGAREQVEHLLGVAEEIRTKYGTLAAHLTLRIKIDDRFDNLMTYFKSNSMYAKDKLYAKLQEVLTLFPAIEQAAYDYFQEYIMAYPLKDNQQYPNGESAVQFCNKLLEMGSYDALLGHHIKINGALNQSGGNSTPLSGFHLPTLDLSVPEQSLPPSVV